MSRVVRVTHAAAALVFASAASAQSGEDLIKKDGCTACHAVDKKIIGPAYQDVAAKYKGDAKAAAYLQDKVKKGGSGVWGQIPMPPNGTVNDAEAHTLAKFILTVK